MSHQVTLSRHNITHKITVRCQHRYALYVNQLIESFNTIIDLSQQPNNTKIAEALRDKKLFQELANLLDAFVVSGVTSDLSRTGAGRLTNQPSDNLFEWLNPAASVMPKPQQIFEPVSNKSYFQLERDHLNNFKLTSREAYLVYAEFYIAKDVKGFFARNPLCQHAVKKIADNFTTNIKTFAINILNDWDDINNCFFGGKAQLLDKITTTGSDYHKGGKQVLILTFQLNGNKTDKLVYKPSDIEVDCRLVGNIQAVKKYLPKKLQITKSFAELVNEFTQSDDCPLQTYKILPRSPGSLLQKNNNGVITIRDSYGYIEYLKHEPGLDATEGITNENRLKQAENVPLNEIADSDWITVNSDDARKYWQTTGKLLAMLIVCGCTDIHGQNFRIHKKKPQVIDLEEAFKERHKTIRDVFSNFETLDRVDDPGTREPEVREDRTLGTFVTFPLKGQGFLLNKLVIRLPAITHKIAERTDYIEPLIKGFIKTLYAFKKDNNNKRILDWLKQAQNMIVRHVTVATSKLASEMRFLMTNKYSETSSEAYVIAPPEYIQNPKPNDDNKYNDYIDFCKNIPIFPYRKDTNSRLFVDKFNTYVKSYYNQRLNRQTTDEDRAWKAVPRFAICHPEHNFHDFFNLDVPSYYHRLSDAHLLNSRGMKVIPKDTWNWWKENVFDENIAPEPKLETKTGRKGTADQFTQFFPDIPYNLFRQIFTDLKDDTKLRKLIEDNIVYLGKGNKKEIKVTVNNNTYTVPVDTNTKTKSLSYASEFQTPSNGEPVLLNGMKVIFDKSAPVYPVSLVNKD